ncbi:Sorting nexin mvp-1 [Paramyrothecium foliicola]|nr:Sorting nexin mvp-1 [Paramyrothecium foliicola]
MCLELQRFTEGKRPLQAVRWRPLQVRKLTPAGSPSPLSRSFARVDLVRVQLQRHYEADHETVLPALIGANKSRRRLEPSLTGQTLPIGTKTHHCYHDGQSIIHAHGQQHRFATMSLFGSSPSDDNESPLAAAASTPKRPKAGGLFDEPSQRNASSNSLFADDDDQNDQHGGSPWDMPTPRKQQSRAELIRNLLAGAAVPDSYVDTFDTFVREDGASGGRVSAGGVAKLFAAARLDADAQARVMSLVAPNGANDLALGRDEFNVLLALVGLAQEGEVVSLDGVDERRRGKSTVLLVTSYSFEGVFPFTSAYHFGSCGCSIIASFTSNAPSRIALAHYAWCRMPSHLGGSARNMTMPHPCTGAPRLCALEIGAGASKLSLYYLSILLRAFERATGFPLPVLSYHGFVVPYQWLQQPQSPSPKLAGLTAEPVLPPVAELAAKAPQTPETPQAPSRNYQPERESAPQQQPKILRPAMDDPEVDPWNSPEVHKHHAHAKTNGNGAHSNGFNDVSSPTFPDHSATQFSAAQQIPALSNAANTTATVGSVPGQSGWGYFDGANSNNNTPGAGTFNDSEPVQPSPFAPTAIGGGVAGSPGRTPGSNAPISIPRTTSGRSAGGPEENILVTLMPEKEGMFMFQHHNYEVASQRRGSRVIRRYSDFVWLLDCLQKRYPFRSLPLLPPKRMAVNGNHLSNDGAFIEKRRRGLARFLNAVVRHPILNQEQLVVMFLTVPTELSVWRKQSAISVQDEFADRALPPGLEDSLPSSLEELFSRTRNGIRRSAELYINVCNIMDRLVKRTEGVAADHARVAMSLDALTELSTDTYATDTNEVPLLNDGLVAMSKHLRTCQSLMEDEARGWDEGVLEDLKRQRDSLVSMRDMFDRRERLDKDNIPYLERRIQTNETRLASLRSKPEGMVKAGEIEKVAESIIKDKESIVQQHNRSIFVKECLRDELVTFQTTQYHVSRWNQDWAGERVKYAEILADNWRRLLDELEGMPLGD